MGKGIETAAPASEIHFAISMRLRLLLWRLSRDRHVLGGGQAADLDAQRISIHIIRWEREI